MNRYGTGQKAIRYNGNIVQVDLPFLKNIFSDELYKIALQKSCNENLTIFFFVIRIEKEMLCVYSKRKR